MEEAPLSISASRWIDHNARDHHTTKEAGRSAHGPKGSGARCHSAAPRRSRKPHPPRIDIDLSEGETLPLVVVENLSRLPDREDAIQGIALPSLEPRLQKRYLIMVQSHMRSAPELAAGVASLPSTCFGVRRNPSCVAVLEQRTGRHCLRWWNRSAKHGRSQVGA